MSEEKKSKESLDRDVGKNDSSKEKNQKNSKGEKRKHRSHSRSKSRSPEHKNKSDKKSEINYDIPDRSFGDLFCSACDCHMNGQHMWESHIQGKRHMKNTKKGAPVDQKYEYLEEDPIIKPEIDAETGPIIGLEHICEIQRLEHKPIYSCFLCSATCPNGQRLIEHTLTLKHRQAYLKEHDPVEYSTIQSAQLKKCHLESIVEECIVRYEKHHGRGKMIVKKEKNKTASSSYEKGYSSDYDSHSNHKYSRHKKSSYSEWKKVSSSGSRNYERERHSSDCRSDLDIDHYYSKEEPHSTPAYYRTALGKEGSPPKSIRSTTGSRYYSREEPESRSTYYQRSSVKGASPPIISSSRYYSDEAPESRSTYYQSVVNKTSPPKIMRNSSGSSHLWADEPEKVDLRRILQQKKGLGTSYSTISAAGSSAMPSFATGSSAMPSSATGSSAMPSSATGSSAMPSSATGSSAMPSSATGSSAMPSSASLPPSTSIANTPESILKFMNALTTDVIFYLSIFAIDNMTTFPDEKTIETLDCLISKATALSCYIKKNKIFPSLQAKLHENMAQNVLYPQSNVDFGRNLNNFIQHYKSQKTLDLDQFQNSEVLDRSNLPLPQSNSNYHPAQLNSGNYSSSLTPSENTSALASPSLNYIRNQNSDLIPNSNLIPFKSFSTTPSSIPGFTFGEEINSLPENPATQINQLQSPFEHFSENAKNILGYFNRPLSKDYNHR